MSDGAPVVAESPLDTLRRYLGVISTWGADSPANFRYLSVIVRAELCRLENDAAEAARLYEEAIRNTRAIGFVHMEALSNELYAKVPPCLASARLASSRPVWLTHRCWMVVL